ncbi:hypothetical protein JCM14244_06510 [Venenivibrio stagnispumantis]|uniref:PemK-like, MazF-like toxin of type II toxin-antitoxin system n=1 Tax=Venenivibrio stagnispumantis TaxID=407998 RepID=A0AA45WIH2_9AQUI|nr:type II toxin-antitoxin system PemK/MazF family toxin [Venenivibrio stagnispumantis]MCW4572594.1 type II toxin-antitoxin system PemK/MazF family toxin [Venenivibrio stagnispumantis]SMP00485.1 PemK-like, MazF-like toxin of type II toxin-antitoxin system [Venenivibrio stagnispumantis]
MVDYIPEKGDIIYLNFDPSLRHEQKGNRYAIVVSHYVFNKNTGMCYAVPITSKCQVVFKGKLPKNQLEKILDIIETIIFS